MTYEALFTPAGADAFSLEVTDYGMTFESLLLSGAPTGTNTVEQLFPHRGLLDDWDFAGGGQDFTFDFSGDATWMNQLFPRYGEDGYVLQSYTGTMAAVNDTQWIGSATLQGGMYAPIPAPSALTLLGICCLGVFGMRKRWAGVAGHP